MATTTYPILHDLFTLWHCHSSSQVVRSVFPPSPPLESRWLFGISTNNIWPRWHYASLQVQSFRYWQTPHPASWKSHFWNLTAGLWGNQIHMEMPHVVARVDRLSRGPSQQAASTTSRVSKGTSRGYQALVIESFPFLESFQRSLQTSQSTNWESLPAAVSKVLRRDHAHNKIAGFFATKLCTQCNHCHR